VRGLLPIVLKPGQARVALIGRGEALLRRRKLLSEAGFQPLLLGPDADGAEFDGLTALFVAGYAADISAGLAAAARACGLLVNVEDRPELCDFHVPAVVRRGDLLISISTSGKSPGLAKLVRQWIERRLGPEWSEQLRETSELRAQWRRSGLPPSEVSKHTAALAAARGWLP
jgi:precorrin-2 dehydrogenase/sirohydrochlorin ferrochelatase